MAATDSQDDYAGMTAFQRDLLVVLADNEPCKGVTVMNAIKDRHPSATAGRIYPNLDDLIVMDVVSKREKDGRTNEYRVTDRGETALADHRQWIADNLDDPEIMADGGVDVGSSEQNPNGVPNAKNHPVKAAEKMLRQMRGEMSGDLYDEHEDVREWAMNIEWAYCALAEHEDSAYDSVEEATDL